MAFDLEYILVDCDHRIRDELLIESVISSGNLLSDASVYGKSFFGRSRFGKNVYAIDNKYGTEGMFFYGDNGNVIAVIPVMNKIASSPELYFKDPNEYLRYSVPQYIYKEFISSIHFGMNLFFGEDTNIMFGGPGYIPSDQATLLWFVTYEPTIFAGYNIPANSIVILNYDNKYNWYLDYTTTAEECPYCNGFGVKNDFRLSKIGRLNLVTNMEKLIQQVIKAIITKQGKNPNFPAYGTIIPNSIGEKGINGLIIREQIFSQLSEIKRVQEIILEQYPNFFTASEVLEDLIGVSIIPSQDKRQLNLEVTIKNKNFETKTSKTFRIF